jgi:hypothetical protein
MVLLSEIIEKQVLAKMDNFIQVSEVVSVVFDAELGYISKVKFCKEKWIRIYLGGTFSGFTNSAVSGNIYEFTGSEPLKVRDKLELPKPKFMHGTPMNTVLEWHQVTDENQKLPLIWLVTPYTEKINDGRQTIERNCDVKILFIHHSNWMELNQTRVNDSIKPLNNMADVFIEAVNTNKRFFDRLKRQTRKEFPKFGRETSQGIDKTLFNSTLAAVQLTTTIDIKKGCFC